MALPGMRERTLRIGSAGKTFSLTGWKVGYVTAAPRLLEPVTKAHQFTTFTTPPGLQKAVAYGLRKDDSYYRALAGDLELKRNHFAAGLAEVGFKVAPCEGTYFITADVAPFGLDGDDVALCRLITMEAGVTAIPVSAFYENAPPASFIRFCFSKRDAVLNGALDRLSRWIERRHRAIA